MDRRQLERLLAPLRRIAIEAGKAILEIAAAPGEVELKEDGSPLTRADRAAHEVIAAGLARLPDAMPIVSEEGDLEAVAAHDLYWLVDPLDGTKEFVKGLGEYTVNIALVEAGRPILGVIYVPAADVIYYAADGCGAFRQAPGGEPTAIAAAPNDPLRVAVVSRSHLSDETKTYLDAHGVTERVSRGSSLKMCAVAEGAADLYPRHGPTMLWDTAAGAAIARCAGCAVVDWSGKDLSYDLQDGLRQSGFLVCPATCRERLLA